MSNRKLILNVMKNIDGTKKQCADLLKQAKSCYKQGDTFAAEADKLNDAINLAETATNFHGSLIHECANSWRGIDFPDYWGRIWRMVSTSPPFCWGIELRTPGIFGKTILQLDNKRARLHLHSWCAGFCISVDDVDENKLKKIPFPKLNATLRDGIAKNVMQLLGKSWMYIPILINGERRIRHRKQNVWVVVSSHDKPLQVLRHNECTRIVDMATYRNQRFDLSDPECFRNAANLAKSWL